MKKNRWYNYLWIWTIIYFLLGFFNILFAWLGMIDFLVPLLFAIIGGNKFFCNYYCGRGQLLTKIGSFSKNIVAPIWISSKYFRYGFLIFFLIMFANMIFQTYLVAYGTESLMQTIKLLFIFNIPWEWAYTANSVPNWITQFSFGFYSIMLTSTIIGFLVNILYKPRTWCSFCPMGTMTQTICKIKAKE